MTQNCIDAGKRRAGYVYVIISAVLWGTLPVFSTLSYKLGGDALTSAAMRSYLSAAIYLVWMIADGSIKSVRLKELPFYMAYGVLACGGAFLCYMTAIERLSTAMAAILLYTGPAFVILFNRILYGEPITRCKLTALLCTLAGSFLVVKGYDMSLLKANAGGILIGLASGVCYSMTTVLGKKAQTMHDGKTNAGLMIIFGTLVFWAIKPAWTVRISSGAMWLSFLGLAVLGTVLAYMLYLKGLDGLRDGGIASIVATLEPLVGTLLCMLVFGESLCAAQVVGIAIELVGICLPILFDASKSRRG